MVKIWRPHVIQSRPVNVETTNININSSYYINFSGANCGWNNWNCGWNWGGGRMSFGTGFGFGLGESLGWLTGGVGAGLLDRWMSTWKWGGSSKSGKCSCGCEKTGKGGTPAPAVNPTNNTPTSQHDKDLAKITEYIGKISKYKNKTELTDEDKAGLKNLYNELKNRAKGNNHEDDIDKPNNNISYGHLLDSLKENFDFDNDGNPTIKTDNNKKTRSGDGNTVSNADEYDKELDKIRWNQPVLPDNSAFNNLTEVEYATENNDFSKMELTHAHDTGKPKDVKATKLNSKINAKYHISNEKTKEGFPKYLEITDTKGSYKYTFAGMVGDKAIYNTPSKDSNNNHYVLCIKDNKLYLLQTAGFKGHNKPDKQND